MASTHVLFEEDGGFKAATVLSDAGASLQVESATSSPQHLSLPSHLYTVPTSAVALRPQGEMPAVENSYPGHPKRKQESGGQARTYKRLGRKHRKGEWMREAI